MSKFYRKLVLIGTLLAIIPQLALAQGWMRTYGSPDAWNSGRWLEITADSGFIICGHMHEGNEEWGYLIKTDAEGDTQWTRTYDTGDPDSIPADGGEFNCVQQTADGGYILSGSALALGGNFMPSIWLVKTDSSGVIQWVRGYGGVKIDKAWFVRQVPDGGYIVVGSTRSFGPGYQGLWILRTDTEGDTLWTRTYGGDEKDWAFCVSLTTDGNYIVTGGNGTQQGLWLLKIDDTGDTIWTKTYVSGGNTWGRYVEQTPDGGFIVTGANWDANNVYLLKTDASGDSLWSRSYKGGGGASEGRCVHQTADGGYVIGARKNYNSNSATCSAWLLKTDANGDTLWTRSFTYYPDLYNDSRCVQPIPDGGYVMTGKTGSTFLDTDQPTDAWLIKTNSEGMVGVEEIDNPPVVETASTVDTHITLYYTDHPNGFHAHVYDASGQKVGEIHNTSMSGTVEWGQGQQAGVYFIRQLSGSPSVQKVVLVR